MAVSLELNVPKRVTLSATIGNVTEVSLPAFANTVEVQFLSAAGKIAWSGTDGAAIGTAFQSYEADTLYRVEVFFRPGQVAVQKLYLASAGAGTVVELRAARSALLGAATEGGGGGGSGGVTDLQGAYDGGATITTAAAVPVTLDLASGDFVVEGPGSVSFGPNTGIQDFFVVQTGTTDISTTGTGQSIYLSALGTNGAVYLNGAKQVEITSPATTGTVANAPISIYSAGEVSVRGVPLDLQGQGTGVKVTSTSAFDVNASGAVTLDGVGNSNLTTSAGSLTLSTTTSGTLGLSSAGDLTFSDQHKAGSTYAGALKLSASSSEYSTFETNYGEVSLLNAINQAKGGGKVLQVVYATTSTQVTVATTTYTDIGLSASITPSSTSSQVLVLGRISYLCQRLAATQGVKIKVLRDSTTIEEGWGAGGIGQFATVMITATGSTDTQLQSVYNLMLLDSPASASALTYKIQGAPAIITNTGSATFQRVGSGGSAVNQVSQLLLIEVAA